MPDVKITVLKTSTEEDFFKEYAHEECEKECPKFNEGEEYIIDAEDFLVPDGFCPSAWDSFSDLIYVLRLNGDFSLWDWTKDEKTAITCCNDGLRPVYFKLETIE